MPSPATVERLSIGAFLASHPGFTFDLEEYLLSTQYVSELEERYAAFTSAMRGDGSDWPARHLIVDGVRRGACDWVWAYQSFKEKGDIASWPFTSKSDLREAPEAYLATDLPRQHLFWKTTHGSSGAPIPIWHTAPFYFDGLLLSLQRIASFWGAEQATSRPVFCLAISDDRAKREFVTADPLGRVGLYARIVVDERRVATYDRALDLLDELCPACVSSKPSILEGLAERAIVSSRATRAPLGLMVSGGAKLERDLQERLDGVFDGSAVESYGMTEFGVVAYPCRRRSLHIDVSSTFVEIVDEDGNVLPEGQPGEIVISSLSNRAMPLLRYRTGDRGAIDSSPCPCGSRAPRLTQLSGRIIRCLQLPSGRLFSPTYFNDTFELFPELVEFQITQTSRDCVEILLEPRADAGVAVDELSERVRAHALHGFGEALTVRVGITRFRKDDKFQRFRSSL
jgi:phenylacetate-CoA ligase